MKNLPIRATLGGLKRGIRGGGGGGGRGPTVDREVGGKGATRGGWGRGRGSTGGGGAGGGRLGGAEGGGGGLSLSTDIQSLTQKLL